MHAWTTIVPNIKYKTRSHIKTNDTVQIMYSVLYYNSRYKTCPSIFLCSKQAERNCLFARSISLPVGQSLQSFFSIQVSTFCSPKEMGTQVPGWSDPWGRWPLFQQRIAIWLPRNKPCQSSFQSAPNSPSPEKKKGTTWWKTR